MLKRKFVSRKVVSFLLAFVFALSTFIPVQAAEMGTEKNLVAKYSELGDNDLFVTEEVATYIAKFFINDMVATGQTEWTQQTNVESVVALYDETGMDVMGYSIELNQGYIVVSAYIDMPSIILEWSDEAEPLYQESEPEEVEKVLYTNTLEYYCVDKAGELRTVDGLEVSQNELQDSLSKMWDVTNVDEDLIQDIVVSKEQNASLLSPQDNSSGQIITDPFTYAKNVYGGTWSALEWANNWENHMNFSSTSDFLWHNNHCGPTAITNIIKSYGNKYNVSSIKNSSSQTVFNKLMDVNAENGYNYFKESGDGAGTTVSTTSDFIKKGFKKFNVNVQVYGMYSPTYQDIKNATTGNRLMYLIVWNNKPYGNHAVVGYAYNRLKNQKGDLSSYLKIADGWSHEGRYLPISTLANDKYYEAYFG